MRQWQNVDRGKIKISRYRPKLWPMAVGRKFLKRHCLIKILMSNCCIQRSTKDIQFMSKIISFYVSLSVFQCRNFFPILVCRLVFNFIVFIVYRTMTSKRNYVFVSFHVRTFHIPRRNSYILSVTNTYNKQIASRHQSVMAASRRPGQVCYWRLQLSGFTCAGKSDRKVITVCTALQKLIVSVEQTAECALPLYIYTHAPPLHAIEKTVSLPSSIRNEYVTSMSGLLRAHLAMHQTK